MSELLMSLEIIYQDEYLVVVNKPSGLLSVPGLGSDNQDSVATRMLALNAEVKVVHRLDCLTSGIMLMAIGIKMQRELSRQFHDRKINKQYIAIVRGVPGEKRGVIEIPMRGDPDDRPRQVVDYQQGKSSITQWKVISVDGDRTRLWLKPVTGRTHQLRIHCIAMGHIIVGDTLYGDEIEKQEKRMLLHAQSIDLFHPATGEAMTLTAPCDF
ncbi:MAG: RluA family pseudouridine synthase [Gammaproteobacteria bacterium]|nr:RluA family pseudouridine synthase [Gammaproteobacteria bacterium]